MKVGFMWECEICRAPRRFNGAWSYFYHLKNAHSDGELALVVEPELFAICGDPQEPPGGWGGIRDNWMNGGKSGPAIRHKRGEPHRCYLDLPKRDEHEADRQEKGWWSSHIPRDPNSPIRIPRRWRSESGPNLSDDELQQVEEAAHIEAFGYVAWDDSDFFD